MKDLLLLFLMIAFGFIASAQLKTLKSNNLSPYFKVNKMEVDFSKVDELSQFKKRLSNGESGIEKLSIDKDFKFIYTLAEPIKLAGHTNQLKKMKVEISGQPNTEALIKEINAAIDGVIR